MSTHSSHAMRRSDPLVVLRYLDVIVVVLAAPFVILTGLPALGYGVGALAWIVQRVVGAAVEARMRRESDIKAQVGLGLASSLGRAWLVGLTILAVGLAGAREDGVTAAVLVLVAYTVYLVTSLALRSFERNPPRT
ncbi:MAG: hypothetical protein QOK21_2771 [Solirubrobacteraceae bacterium]|jgi:hypothetical protein|nr:hypothetical protein [Solirubrobacteraceae bacterium]